MKRCLLAFLAVLLSACATPNVEPGFDVAKAVQSGLVTGSITYEGIYGAYTVHVRSKDRKTAYRLQHGASQTLNFGLAFKGEAADAQLGQKGSVFAVELPAGEYTIVGWQLVSGMADVTPTTPTQIDFKVEPKTAIYLGNFDFRVTRTFMRTPTEATVTLSDRRERDLAAFRKAFPDLAATPVEQAIVSERVVKDIGGPSRGRIELPLFVPVGR